MMATEIKHQPFIVSSSSMAHHSTTKLGLVPELMMVNGDMTKDLRHLDRETAARESRSAAHVLSNGILSTFNGGPTKKLDTIGVSKPPMRELKLIGPRTSSIESSDEDDTCPTYVAAKTIFQDTPPNLAALARPFRRRCQSTPVAGSGQRRTIFDSFWKRDESMSSSASGDGDSDTQSATSARSIRSSKRSERSRAYSLSAVPDSPSTRSQRQLTDENSGVNTTRDSISIRMFSPPVKHKSVLTSHFEGLEELPPDLQVTLPPLPSPLSRTYRGDGTQYCSGMYPLVSPKSILQKSSYTPEEGQAEVPDRQSGKPPLSPFTGDFRKSAKGAMVLPLPLALTDSIHLNSIHLNNLRRGDHGVPKPMSTLLDEADSDESSSSQSAKRPSGSVHFDPRVTVTEYSDNQPRQWYADAELDNFKVETILLAQRYLRTRPDLLADYCAGVVNPVTGVAKRKALYSLPILNDVSLEEGESCDDSIVASLSQSSSPKTAASPKATFLYDYAKMAKIHVRKILIVDPNKLILDLFCRSLRQIFPDAELATVQTGDEAIRCIHQLFKERLSQSTVPRGYDLIIVEERLHALPLRGYGHSPRPLRTTQSKGRQEKSFTKVKHSSMTQLADYNKATAATGSSCQSGMLSGAEVICQIKDLEDEFCSPDRCIREESYGSGTGEEPSQQERVCWRSLLIGVCVDQKHDTLKLWQSGADLVWGKPPPPMGENLRNQLVSMLVRKRSPSFLS